MTVKEFYEWCKARGAEDYTLGSAGIKRGYEIHEGDIEVKEDHPDAMRGEIWV